MTSRFHPFVRLLLCAIGLLAVTVLLTGTLAAGNYISTVFTDLPPKESFEEMVKRYQLPITLLTYPACLLLLDAFRTKLDKASFASLGLRPIKVAPNLLRGAIAGILTIGILWSILWLTGAIMVEGWSPAFFENPAGAILPLSGYFLAFCAVAFFEEILFRGYILHNLNAWLGWRLAVVGQAALFAVVHLGNVLEADAQGKVAALWALPALFLIAVFFAVSYRKTGSLWFPIGFHALWNFSLGCLFSLPVSGIETYRILEVSQNKASLLSGGSFGAEGSLYLPVLLLVMIYFMSGAPNHPQATLDLSLLTKNRPAAASEVVEDEQEEELGPNRFQTRFGSQEGFDSQTLRELRALQSSREESKPEQIAVESVSTLTQMPIVAVAEPISETVQETQRSAEQLTPALQTNLPSAAPREATVPTTPEAERVTQAEPVAQKVETPIVVQPVPEVVAPASSPATEPPVDLPKPQKKPSPKW